MNGWTAWLTAAGGVLVLIGALQHVVAKAISLGVGIALAAATGMALVAGDVLGLAAANGYTALGWGVAAALLILTALLPRRTHDVPDRTDEGRVTAERDGVRRTGGVVGNDRKGASSRV